MRGIIYIVVLVAAVGCTDNKTSNRTEKQKIMEQNTLEWAKQYLPEGLDSEGIVVSHFDSLYEYQEEGKKIQSEIKTIQRTEAIQNLKDAGELPPDFPIPKE